MTKFFYPKGNSMGKILFQKLLKKSENEAFDDSYLEDLILYQKLYPKTEKFAVFYAKYALYHKNYQVALETLLDVFKRHKLNLEIWLLFVKVYKALGYQEEALMFQGLCNQHYSYPIEFTLSRKELKHALKRLSKVMGNGDYAPYQLKCMQFDGTSMKDSKGFFLGEFLPTLEEEEELAYWVGVYAGRGNRHEQGWLASQHKDDELFVTHGGAGFTFDIMRSTLASEYNFDDKKTVLLSLAGTKENQIVKFSLKNLEMDVRLGQYEYNFFRLDEPIKITAQDPFVVGRPVVLGHAKHRKKIVLNIMLDAFSFAEFRENKYALMPNTMKFFEKGIIFNQHFSIAEYTYPSLPTIETGLYPHHSGVFNSHMGVELDKKYITLSEQMKKLGYYTINVMGSGDGIYNGVTRGHERLIVTSYNLFVDEGVSRVIRQIDAFNECDQFIWLHLMDVHPWRANIYQLALSTETKLTLKERLNGINSEKNSVYLPATPMYQKNYHTNLKYFDQSIKRLFDYLLANYKEDEFIVQFYSDHGVPIFDEKHYLLSDRHTGAAYMLRGSGIPSLGVVNELTSAIDIYPTLGKLCDFPVPSYIDGNLPKALGGKEREYVISYSNYPGIPYILCIRTKKHEFRLETQWRTDEDGSNDLSGAKMAVYTRDEKHQFVEDKAIYDYFVEIVKKHTASFNNEGHRWPSMLKSHEIWFAKKFDWSEYKC